MPKVFIIKFFNQKEKQELGFLFETPSDFQQKKQVFDEARKKLFQMCLMEKWTHSSNKQELIGNKECNSDNYDPTKIYNSLNNELIMSLNDSYYYYDNYKTFFKVFSKKKKK